MGEMRMQPATKGETAVREMQLQATGRRGSSCGVRRRGAAHHRAVRQLARRVDPGARPRHQLGLAVGETGILLQPPLHSAGASVWTERGCQQNDSLADGQPGLPQPGPGPFRWAPERLKSCSRHKPARRRRSTCSACRPSFSRVHSNGLRLVQPWLRALRLHARTSQTVAATHPESSDSGGSRIAAAHTAASRPTAPSPADPGRRSQAGRHRMRSVGPPASPVTTAVRSTSQRGTRRPRWGVGTAGRAPAAAGCPPQPSGASSTWAKLAATAPAANHPTRLLSPASSIVKEAAQQQRSSIGGGAGTTQ